MLKRHKLTLLYFEPNFLDVFFSNFDNYEIIFTDGAKDCKTVESACVTNTGTVTIEPSMN